MGTAVKVRRSAPLGKAFAMYVAYRQLDAKSTMFFAHTPPVELHADDTPATASLADGDVVVVGLFQPFAPDHSEYCDLAFVVDGYVFKAHKYPMLRTGSPLIESTVEMSTPDNPLPLDVPGGARVFDVISRCIHAERVDAALDKLLTPASFVPLRVACSYLQFEKLAVAVDAWLDAHVLPDMAATLSVLACALTVDAASLPENNVVAKCVTALGITMDWPTVGAGSDAGLCEAVFGLPPQVFVDIVLASIKVKAPASELAPAVLAYLSRAAGSISVAMAADETASPSFAVADGALVVPEGRVTPTPHGGLDLSVFDRVMHLLDPGALTANQGLALLRTLQACGPHVVASAQAWLDALTDGASSVTTTSPLPTHSDALQLCVFVLSANLSEIVEGGSTSVSWIAASVFALVVRQAGVTMPMKRHAVATYLLSRTDDGHPPLTFDDLRVVMHGTWPFVGPDEDAGPPGDGPLAQFYGAVYECVVWLFAAEAVDVSSRDQLLGSIPELALEHLPMRMLEQSVSSPHMPQQRFIDALVKQNVLLRDALLAAQKSASAAASADMRSRMCRVNHIPVGTRLAVKRSAGAFAAGVIVSYSPDTRMHCVSYGPSDRRWYDLSHTVYEIISVKVSSSDEDDEDECSEQDDEEDDTDGDEG